MKQARPGRWQFSVPLGEYAFPVGLRRVNFFRMDRDSGAGVLRNGYSEDDARTLVEYLNTRHRAGPQS